MKIGIICAMNEEFELIHKNITVKKITEKSNLKFIEGTLHNKEIVGVICGIGKVNAAICTQMLISEFNCTHILNSGVAGGIKPGINFKDVVIATDLIQHDVDVTKFGYKIGEVPNIGTYEFKTDAYLLNLAKNICTDLTSENPNFKFHMGRIVTGDQFISDNKTSEYLHNTFNAYACEMESASIAHTCYLNEVCFLIIRSISDNGGNIAENEFNTFLKEASKNSYIILEKIIKEI